MRGLSLDDGPGFLMRGMSLDASVDVGHAFG